jgi:SAM-dependent methyltransferase
MTNTELRAKYGDFTKTDVYEYPSHFFCPWDDFTMHITNWQSFLTRFEAQPDLNFLELGTAQGRATVWLLENVLTATNSKITTVDMKHLMPVTKDSLKQKLDNQDVVIDCLDNLAPYLATNRCTFVLDSTDNFFKTNKQQFDFVYVDASHDPDQVLRDAINSFDVVKPNGLLLFDDYGWGDCAIGIESFVQSFKHKVNVLHRGYQVLVEKR